MTRSGAVSYPHRNPFRRPLTAPELAYIAAIIDGEGHIGIHRGKRQKWTVYIPTVGVANQSEALIHWIDERVAWTTRCLRVDTSGHSWAYKPALVGRAVGDFLTALLPYLVIKGDRAELVIRYCQERALAGANTRITAEQIAMVDQVKALNAKRSMPTSALSLSAPSGSKPSTT